MTSNSRVSKRRSLKDIPCCAVQKHLHFWYFEVSISQVSLEYGVLFPNVLPNKCQKFRQEVIEIFIYGFEYQWKLPNYICEGQRETFTNKIIRFNNTSKEHPVS